MEQPDTLHFALQDSIDDAEINPSRIPLALLGQFRADVEDFLKGSGKEVDPTKVLVSIEQGSFSLVATVEKTSAPGLWNDVAQLQDPSTLGSVDPKRAAVVARWQEATRRNPHRSYGLTDKKNNLTIRVHSGSDFYNRDEGVWIEVEKYLQGTVIDAGGSTNPNIHLRVGNDKLIVASSQKLLEDEEKNLLYRSALLHVSAEENLKTGELRNYKLLSIENYQPVWDEAEFNILVEKGTQAWKDVPDDWLEEMRGGRK